MCLKRKNLTLNVDDEGGKKCLLNNISFQVDDGEMLVITGPNGGGKSTLAKTLIGIQTPDSGKIILDGQDITELDINHRANAGIGFAFQQPPRFKGMTVMKPLKLANKGGSFLTRSARPSYRSRTLCKGLHLPSDRWHTLRWRDEAY